MDDIGFLLLCGGRSTRMGQNKAMLEVSTGKLYETVARAGSSFSERLFSVNDPAVPTPEGFTRIPDLREGCGPLGGLHAALTMCGGSALVTAPCDAPYYSEALALFLASCFRPDLDAVILVEESGREHPLIGVYAKGCLRVVERMLDAGDYKVMRMLENVRLLRVIPPVALGKQIFVNLNTPKDVLALSTELPSRLSLDRSGG